jgi:hypothetical protein
MEGKKGSVITIIHHASTVLSTSNTHKGVLVVLIVRAIQIKQTPIGPSTQRNNILGKQDFNMVERKEDGH